MSGNLLTWFNPMSDKEAIPLGEEDDRAKTKKKQVFLGIIDPSKIYSKHEIIDMLRLSKYQQPHSFFVSITNPKTKFGECVFSRCGDGWKFKYNLIINKQTFLSYNQVFYRWVWGFKCMCKKYNRISCPMKRFNPMSFGSIEFIQLIFNINFFPSITSSPPE